MVCYVSMPRLGANTTNIGCVTMLLEHRRDINKLVSNGFPVALSRCETVQRWSSSAPSRGTAGVQQKHQTSLVACRFRLLY